MYCQNCGNEVIKSSKFCPYCGQKLAAAPTVPSILFHPPSVISRSASPSSKRILIPFGVVVLIGLVVAIYFLLTGVLGSGVDEQRDALTAADGSNTFSTKSNDELAREMTMTCFLYDTNGVEQADGTLVGNWFVGGDNPDTKYKDLLIEIRPQEVSRSERANGWVYQSYAYVDYLYANLDGGGGGWHEGQKSYEIHISAVENVWEGIEGHLRKCGLPEPPKPTTEAEAITANLADDVNASVVDQYLVEENDWYMLVVNLDNNSEQTWDICVRALAAVYNGKRTGHPDAIWRGQLTDCHEDFYALPPGETQVEIPISDVDYLKLNTPNVVGPDPVFRQLCILIRAEGGDLIEASKLYQEDECSDSIFDYEGAMIDAIQSSP